MLPDLFYTVVILESVDDTLRNIEEDIVSKISYRDICDDKGNSVRVQIYTPEQALEIAQNRTSKIVKEIYSLEQKARIVSVPHKTKSNKTVYYYNSEEARAYIVYRVFDNGFGEGLIQVFAVYTYGCDFPAKLDTNKARISNLYYCYEHHLRVPLRVRESLRRSGYRVIEGHIIGLYGKAVSE